MMMDEPMFEIPGEGAKRNIVALDLVEVEGNQPYAIQMQVGSDKLRKNIISFFETLEEAEAGMHVMQLFVHGLCVGCMEKVVPSRRKRKK